MAVAAAPGLRAVVVAVLAVDGAGGVVVRRLHAADGAHLLARLAARLAAVLPLPGHPAAEGWTDGWTGSECTSGPETLFRGAETSLSERWPF